MGLRSVERKPPGGSQHVNDAVNLIDESFARLEQLPANWDGYGAPPIDRQVTAAARRFLASLPAATRSPQNVAPLSNGTLQLEWHTGRKSLELEFESANSIRYLQWDPEGGIEAEDSFAIDDVGLACGLIEWVAGEANA